MILEIPPLPGSAGVNPTNSASSLLYRNLVVVDVFGVVAIDFLVIHFSQENFVTGSSVTFQSVLVLILDDEDAGVVVVDNVLVVVDDILVVVVCLKAYVGSSSAELFI